MLIVTAVRLAIMGLIPKLRAKIVLQNVYTENKMLQPARVPATKVGRGNLGAGRMGLTHVIKTCAWLRWQKLQNRSV